MTSNAQPQQPITSFLELPLPFGSTLKQAPNDVEGEMTVIGFKVRPAERALIQEYINCMKRYPLPNPQGGPPIPWLKEDSIGLLVKNAAISYLMQFNFIMSQMAAEIQRQRQQQQQQQQQQAQQQQRGNGQGQAVVRR